MPGKKVRVEPTVQTTDALCCCCCYYSYRAWLGRTQSLSAYVLGITQSTRYGSMGIICTAYYLGALGMSQYAEHVCMYERERVCVFYNAGSSTRSLSVEIRGPTGVKNFDPEK